MTTTGIFLVGNVTDKALLKFITKENFDKIKSVKIEKSQSFNSANKYSTAYTEGITVFKGTPERLLKKAKKYIDINRDIKDR